MRYKIIPPCYSVMVGFLFNMTGTSYRIKETKKIKSDKSCIINFLYICSYERMPACPDVEGMSMIE